MRAALALSAEYVRLVSELLVALHCRTTVRIACVRRFGDGQVPSAHRLSDNIYIKSNQDRLNAQYAEKEREAKIAKEQKAGKAAEEAEKRAKPEEPITKEKQQMFRL